MNSIAGLGVVFEETLSGWVGMGETDFMEGKLRGQRDNGLLKFDARVKIPNLQQFLDDPDHLAHLEGTVTYAPFGGSFPMRHGVFSLYSVNPKTGIIQMTYAFGFTTSGKNYYVLGRKNIKHHAGRIDVFGDMTTLYTRIYEGEDDSGAVHASGVIYFKFLDFVPLMIYMKVPGAHSFLERMFGKKEFLAFSIRVLAKEYL
ncbi:MAG: hypothetical protein HY912_18765 [Desulfomonile tiedjei]|uniref:Uncharacterized protein n=1 Tax=Desulfomonile tiedjei TaxID=2358 RepID=A0A9D6V4U5_9BACT|nr:hypothetical protein [Desulfomonile tiedjei]